MIVTLPPVRGGGHRCHLAGGLLLDVMEVGGAQRSVAVLRVRHVDEIADLEAVGQARGRVDARRQGALIGADRDAVRRHSGNRSRCVLRRGAVARARASSDVDAVCDEHARLLVVSDVHGVAVLEVEVRERIRRHVEANGVPVSGSDDERVAVNLGQHPGCVLRGGLGHERDRDRQVAVGVRRLGDLDHHARLEAEDVDDYLRRTSLCSEPRDARVITMPQLLEENVSLLPFRVRTTSPCALARTTRALEGHNMRLVVVSSVMMPVMHQVRASESAGRNDDCARRHSHQDCGRSEPDSLH